MLCMCVLTWWFLVSIELASECWQVKSNLVKEERVRCETKTATSKSSQMVSFGPDPLVVPVL